MKLNTNIPGWNGDDILAVIAKYAAMVPEDGHILELGALFGRSTYVLGHNKKESVKLTTIDIWPTILLSNHTEVNYHNDRCGAEELALVHSKLQKDPDRLEGDDFFELWEEFTKGIPNLQGIRTFTNMNNHHFPMVDIIFHDAGHSYEDVYNDLVHWFPKLKHDGIVIVDDYEPTQFMGVVKAVDQFAEENDLVKEMVTSRNILIGRKK